MAEEQESRSKAPPLIVVDDDELLRDAANTLEAQGFRLHHGWSLTASEWPEPLTRVVCTGTVEGADDAEAALRIALRGVGLLVHVPDLENGLSPFVDDLRRIGSVDIRPLSLVKRRLLGVEERGLLALLATGQTVTAACQELHISRRTASRRLASARGHLGVRTTAEAILAAQDQGPLLVGRAREMKTLEELVSDAMPVAVVAEAGIGKTSILEETARRSVRPAFVGGGLATLSWVSFLPVTRAIGSAMPNGDELVVARAIRERVGPGVLILDDLHWADEDTLGLLPYVAGKTRIVVAVRSDDAGAARALSAVQSAGFELLALEPLSDELAGGFLRLHRPEVSSAGRRKLVRLAAGNPLLLLELSAGGQPSPTLRVSLANRLSSLSPVAREAMARLSLLGRPADVELIGSGLEELRSIGVVVVEEGSVRLRHPLLGEAAARDLSNEERRRLHAGLARALPDPGEAARHHQLGGEPEAARAKALHAADRSNHVGERARNLAVAAECAEVGDHATRLKAAGALIEAGDYGTAERIARAVTSDDPQLEAEALLLVAQAIRSSRGPGEAQDEIDRALSLVAGTGSLVEIRIRLEDLWSLVRRWSDRTTVGIAERVLALAEGTSEEPRATWTLGLAHFVSGSVESLPILQKALKAARRDGDTALECDAAAVLGTALANDGDLLKARQLAEEMISRARRQGLASREGDFRLILLSCFERSGEIDRSIRVAFEVMEDRSMQAGSLDEVAAYLALALVDSDRLVEAREVLDEVFQRGGPEMGMVWWALAELELAEGHFDRVLWASEQAQERHPADPNVIGVWATRGWANLELEREIEDPPTPAGWDDHPWVISIGAELRALRALAGRRYDEAETLFLSAAEPDTSIEYRRRLRCLWAAGVSALRAGAVDRARQRLLGVERMAADRGMHLLLARSRNSLRQAGMQRSSPRSARAEHSLTLRELEILALVGKGTRTAGIARRLGLQPSTVNTIVKSAMRKLGARTRIEAARLARSAAEATHAIAP